MNINKEECIAANQGIGTVKSNLRKAIQMALIGSVLVSGVANAILQDHGPGDATLAWPLWYRDNNNLALGLCKSKAASPVAGGTYCFPTPNDPAFFAGNIGGEVFYTNLNVNVTNPSIDLRYVTALEAAYGNAAGSPIKGQEIVFSRVRFLMHVLKQECAGNYVIYHPFGKATYPNVPFGQRALFDTIDIPLGALGDFEGALNGDMGPYLMWDDPANPGAPLNTTALRTANGLTATEPGTGVPVEFVGDPTVPHTFVGSTFFHPNEGVPVLADGTSQNYVEVQYTGPNNNCDLDGSGNPYVRISNGLLMGQVWTAPIPTPSKVDKAVYSSGIVGDSPLNSVDVWAKSAPGQTLVLTGNNLPTVQMKPDAAKPNTYHAHIEYSGNVGQTVEVTNLTSVPISQSTGPLRDLITLTSVEYDTTSRGLCITGHSLDQLNPPQLTVQVPVIGALGGTPGVSRCPQPFPAATPDSKDLSFYTVLPLNAMPTPTVIVKSSREGLIEQDITEFLPGTADNVPGGPVAVNDSYPGDGGVVNIPGLGSTPLPVAVNDTVPTADVFIISQPSNGTVTGSNNGSGIATYTAVPAAQGASSFTYILRDPASGLYSNVATASLNVTFVPQPSTGVADNFAVQRSNLAAQSLNVALFANDTTPQGTNIDPTTLVVSNTANGAFSPVGTATRVNVNGGSILRNANGTVNFIGSTAAGALSAVGNYNFFYKVNNGNGLSAATRVDVVVENASESVSITRNRFANNKAAGNGAWDLRIQTTWPQVAGVMAPSASCYLVRVNGANIAPALIGSAVVDTAGAALIQAVSGAGGVPGVATGQSYSIQCATSNHIAAYPTNINTNSTPINAATAQ